MQLVRWVESWIRDEDLGLDALVTTYLEGYIRSVTRDHIFLRYQEDGLFWKYALAGIYTPKAGYIILSGMGLNKEVAWWWKTLWNIKCP